ncbi:hypothetical protein L227DRAFT_574362 [Lentinus tigrinus ALCF2SS1-6]|uniref:NTF2-domain-containing protein n=1 Tax=Lentinus tigrinus ALCF2SS1-6 TaxID=1328759 RepID=A0A5C2SDR6_9APHY|nr:hypothetical protein L227DRAFT_574362 [Lentinus tigrinus ALCF2SS1-6]
MTNTTVNPSEVGWQFVPQYYTFVNKHPNRLHCFYTKASTFIHGTEGEDGKPCFGQQEIHNKITSIGFQDCKVFIHSVDAQSSANGGIIIQVIGEMSNKGEDWRKFVQTFFLAEQPNGYFVLNDIFRFLKEESVEEGEEQAETEAPQAQEEHAPVPPVPASPAPPPPAEPEPVPSHSPAPPPVVEERAPSPEPSPSPQPQVNGHAPEVKPEPTPAPREPSPAPVPAAAPEPTSTASPAPASPAPPPHQQPAPSPAPPAQQQVPQPQQPPAQPAPLPAAPSAPKSWASLAATGAKSWGAAVASQARGVTEAPAPTSSASPVPLSGPQSPAPHVTTRPLRQEPHPALLAAQALTTPQCFVKSVTENVSEAALRTTLTARFGPIKELEIVRNKACAFLEFQHLEAAKRAIVASLPVPQGGEGGIRIETDGGAGQARIIVETRKERGERPPPRGPPMNGERGRGGGFRGRGAPRGRGGPPPKQ